MPEKKPNTAPSSTTIMLGVSAVLAGALAIFWAPFFASATDAADSRHFYATAIVTNSQNRSEFQCWRLSKPAASIAGIVDILNFPTTNATYSVYPGRLNSGLHSAPTKQMSVWLSGVIQFTVPDAKTPGKNADEFWVTGGSSGIILSLDTQGPGHETNFPTDVPTVALQIPLTEIPEHTVLNRTACRFGTVSSQILAQSA